MGGLFSSRNDGTSSSSTISELTLPSNNLYRAESLRSEANQLHSQAQRESRNSQRAYQSGLGLEARELSVQSAELYRQRNEKNRQAAKLIFEHFNQTHSIDKIDLHRLYVEEALEYLQRRADQCRANDILKLTVVTGIGNNSPNGIARIRPEVEQFTRERQLKITQFPGHLVIHFSRNEREREVAQPSNNFTCIIQ